MNENICIHRNGHPLCSVTYEDLLSRLRVGSVWLSDQVGEATSPQSVEDWLSARNPAVASHPLFAAAPAATKNGLPVEAQGLCWGGWGLGIFWLLRFRLWSLAFFWLSMQMIALYYDLADSATGLPGTDFVFFMFSLLLLFRGRELAWRKGGWDDTLRFGRIQHRWGIAGALVGVIIYSALAFQLWINSGYSRAATRFSPDALQTLLMQHDANRHARNTLGQVMWTLGKPAQSACAANAAGTQECRLLYAGRLVNDAPAYERLRANYAAVPEGAPQRAALLEQARKMQHRWFELRFVALPHRWFGSLALEWAWDGQVHSSGGGMPASVGHDLGAGVCRKKGSETGSLAIKLEKPGWVMLGKGNSLEFQAFSFAHLDAGVHHFQRSLPVEVFVDHAEGVEAALYDVQLDLKAGLIDVSDVANEPQALNFQLMPLVGACPPQPEE